MSNFMFFFNLEFTRKPEVSDHTSSACYKNRFDKTAVQVQHFKRYKVCPLSKIRQFMNIQSTYI